MNRRTYRGNNAPDDIEDMDETWEVRERENVECIERIVQRQEELGLSSSTVPLDRMAQEVRELRRVLAMVEWVDGEEWPYCPWCQQAKPWESVTYGRHQEGGGHAPDCPRQRVLGVTERE